MRKRIVIVGGGACSIMLGCSLDPRLFSVDIFERNAAIGRKFLVAGDGGLNLTHSEDPDLFLERYSPQSFIDRPFRNFSNLDFIDWLNKMGIETFTGSSGRIFPVKGLKPIEVLNTLSEKMKSLGVKLNFKHFWKGFDEDENLLFEKESQLIKVEADIIIFCLGGASWPVTGSKGEWLDIFASKKIKTEKFEPSNCSFVINWPSEIISKIEGKALKNISIHCDEALNLGEVILTKIGIEGSGIYPLSPRIRKQLKEKGQCQIYIDFKPGLSHQQVVDRVRALKPANFTDQLKVELNLSLPSLQLLKSFTTKDEFLNRDVIARLIKKFPLTIIGSGPLDDAISTVGGIALSEIDQHFKLRKMNKVYTIGEMLDYDAPTGGYLLQSCFTMGKFLAEHLNETHQ